MIKIKSVPVKRERIRSFTINLPQVFLNDNELRRGDTVEMYRTEKSDEIVVKIRKGAA